MSTSATSATKSENAPFRLATFTIYGEKGAIPDDLDWPKLGKKPRFLAYGSRDVPQNKKLIFHFKIMSASSLARYILRNRKHLRESIIEYKRRFNLE